MNFNFLLKKYEKLIKFFYNKCQLKLNLVFLKIKNKFKVSSVQIVSKLISNHLLLIVNILFVEIVLKKIHNVKNVKKIGKKKFYL